MKSLRGISMTVLLGEEDVGAHTYSWDESIVAHTLYSRCILFLFLKQRLPIIVKLGPLKEATAILAWHVTGIAHPKVLAKVLLLLGHHPEDAGDLA